jgi:hypothetical protein
MEAALRSFMYPSQEQGILRHLHLKYKKRVCELVELKQKLATCPAADRVRLSELIAKKTKDHEVLSTEMADYELIHPP